MAKFGKRRLREMGLLPPLARKEKVSKPTIVVDLNKNVNRFNNLRLRPFLVIEIYAEPADQANTNQKDWQKIKGNIRSSERHSIVNHISRNTLVRSEAIIDIMNDCLVKNRFDNLGQDPITFDQQMLDYFKTKHADVIARSKTVFHAQNAVASAKEALRKVAA